MNKHDWKNQGDCRGMDTELFFDKYEEDPELRPEIDEICAGCPVMKQCFAVGISNKGWGVWGGIYIENGKISREFGNHRTKAQWAEKWQQLTMDKE